MSPRRGRPEPHPRTCAVVADPVADPVAKEEETGEGADCAEPGPEPRSPNVAPNQTGGFGSGMTCWRRLAEWTEAGVWARLHEVLLAKLRSVNALDFSRAAVDGSHIRAL